MKVQKSYSTEKPPEWDTTSSAFVVYHNTDVEEQTATEDMPKMYSYTQTVYTREEYMQLAAQENAQRIELAEKAILAIMDIGMGVQ